MKVIQEQQPFAPVTLVLDTPEELALLASLFGGITEGACEAIVKGLDYRSIVATFSHLDAICDENGIETSLDPVATIRVHAREV